MGRTRDLARHAVLVGAVVLGVEAVVRAEDWVIYRMPVFSRYRSQGELVVRDADGAHARPAARYRKFVINALGLRGPEVSAAKPPGTLRVVTAGASETFGLVESPGGEYPRQLEDSLGRILAVAGCGRMRVEVLNAAFPGMSLPTVAQDVRLRIRRYGPDVVIYYPTPAQYLSEREPSPTSPRTDAPPPEPPLARALYPRSLARLRAGLGSLVPAPARRWLRQRREATAAPEGPPGWRFTSPPRSRLEAFDRHLRMLVSDIRGIGAIPVLVVRAHALDAVSARSQELLRQWLRHYPRATSEALVGFESDAREIIRQVAADSALVAVDLAAAFGGHGDTLFADFAHLTDAGAAVVAGLLARGTVVAARGRC